MWGAREQTFTKVMTFYAGSVMFRAAITLLPAKLAAVDIILEILRANRTSTRINRRCHDMITSGITDSEVISAYH